MHRIAASNGTHHTEAENSFRHTRVAESRHQSSNPAEPDHCKGEPGLPRVEGTEIRDRQGGLFLEVIFVVPGEVRAVAPATSAGHIGDGGTTILFAGRE